MLRTLSTGASLISELMAAARQAPASPPRPDLLEFLLVRNLGAHEASHSPPKPGVTPAASSARPVAVKPRIAAP